MLVYCIWSIPRTIRLFTLDSRRSEMKLIDKTTIKFILVGIVNTLVGTGVMF